MISGINGLKTRNSLDLEYTDDITCTFDSFEEAQATLKDVSVPAPSKFRILLTDWKSLITPLTLSDEVLNFIDEFTYLGSCMHANGNIADEITSRISRAPVVYGILCHLWRTYIHIRLRNVANTCRGPSSTASFRSQMC